MLKQRFNISLDREGRVLDTLQVSSKLQNGRANECAVNEERRKKKCMSLPDKKGGSSGGETQLGCVKEMLMRSTGEVDAFLWV